MLISLNFKSGKPAYLQIVEQVRSSAAMGELRPGDALPSIRVLAERLRLNRNTVAKAYAELEREGVVTTERGKGVFCAAGQSPLSRKARAAILTDVIDVAVVQAHHFQVSRKELLALVEERIAKVANQADAMQAEGKEKAEENHDE
jgi:GntR family transcriptional regulator